MNPLIVKFGYENLDHYGAEFCEKRNHRMYDYNHTSLHPWWMSSDFFPEDPPEKIYGTVSNLIRVRHLGKAPYNAFHHFSPLYSHLPQYPRTD